MAKHARQPPPPADAKPTLAMTKFGVNTPCCEAVRAALESEYELLTFHATGAGGKAMEKLALTLNPNPNPNPNPKPNPNPNPKPEPRRWRSSPRPACSRACST